MKDRISVDVGLAIKSGLDEAVFIEVVGNLPASFPINSIRKGGRIWVPLSVITLTSLFPFWTPKQIRRVIKSVVAKGIVSQEKLSENKTDRTNWYSVIE